MPVTSGFSRFSLGGDGGVAHKLGVDIVNGVKWTLKFECSGASGNTDNVRSPSESRPPTSPPRSRATENDSAEAIGPVVLRSSGAAVRVSGRIRNVKSNKERSFDICMDDAKKLSLDVTDLSTDRSSVSDLFDQTSPVGFWRILVTASGFAELGVPHIDSLRLEAICADKITKATCNIPGNAVLLRGSIFFSPDRGGDASKDEELLVDDITLLNAEVYLPGEASGMGPGVSSSRNVAGIPNNSNIGSPPRWAPLSRGLSKTNLGHTRINQNSNVLPVGSHRQKSRFFSLIFSSRVLMAVFFAFVAWALTYTATISRTEALYSSAAVMGAYLALGLAVRIVQYLTRKPVLNARSFFVNSYNAWGYCGSVAQGEQMPVYAMPSVLVRAFHDGSPSLDINLGKHSRSSNLSLASDMYTLLADRCSRAGLVAGFLSQREQFSCIAVNDSYDYMSVRCACDGVVVLGTSASASALSSNACPPTPLATDWFYLQAVSCIDENDPLEKYMVTSGRYNSARVRMFLQGTRMRATPPSGWCSWYHFFNNIHEDNLKQNVEAMVSIKQSNGINSPRHGFDLFQIDDGYQRAWGDWLSLDKKKFPNMSLGDIVSMVKDKGMIPGVWMAPFAVDKHSAIAREHPSWILRQGGPNSKPANSANCGKWFYGIDVTNPEVRAHLRECISTMTSQWGFQYLKLDFLYCAALADAQKSYFDRTLTRAQAMQVAMQTVTQSAGPYVYLLGCGAPMGSVIGHVHANRVSADAGLSWYPEFPLPSHDKWNLPSARSMVRNTICRMSMHGRWWINDPDCMLLRRSTAFTDDEIIGIATVKAMCGGSFILSDDLGNVPEDRMRIAHQLLPATNQSAVAVDLMDSEMPEILRLQLAQDADPQGQGNQLVACLASWTLLAVCNWSEEAKSHKVSLATALGHELHNELVQLNSSAVDGNGSSSSSSSSGSGVSECDGPVLVHMFDFWTSEYSNIVLGDSGLLSENVRQAVLRFPPVSAHSARVYALRVMVDPKLPMYVGSNLHFTCGMELASFSVVREVSGLCGGEMLLSAPSSPSPAPASAQPEGNEGRTKEGGDSNSVTRTWTCSLVFEDGAVRNATWKGFVWVYLPVEESHLLRLLGPSVNRACSKPMVSVSNIVVPLSGHRGTVFKISVAEVNNPDATASSGDSVVGEDNTRSEEKLPGKGNNWLEISWDESITSDVAEADAMRSGEVLFRS